VCVFNAEWILFFAYEDDSFPGSSRELGNRSRNARTGVRPGQFLKLRSRRRILLISLDYFVAADLFGKLGSERNPPPGTVGAGGRGRCNVVTASTLRAN
jgi:hypothetical protein